MKIVIGIPARLASTRMPKKPLCKILDMSMIKHIYKRCQFSNYKDDVFIVVPEEDKELINAIKEFGGNILLTKSSREKYITRPGYRIIEASKQLGLTDDDIIVVVQGDEPFIYPDMIDKVIECKIDSNADIIHLISEANNMDYNNPDEIKVVVNGDWDTIFMSRSPIPCIKYAVEDVPIYKQMCIFAFNYSTGLELMRLDPCPLENAEYIEMARPLYYGYKIKCILTDRKTKMIDTEEDRIIAEEMMKEDELYKMGY